VPRNSPHVSLPPLRVPRLPTSGHMRIPPANSPHGGAIPMVIDNRIVIAGSFNCTAPANEYNDERIRVTTAGGWTIWRSRRRTSRAVPPAGLGTAGSIVLTSWAHQTVPDQDRSAELGRLRARRVAAASRGGRDDRDEVRNVRCDGDGCVIRDRPVRGQDRLPNSLGRRGLDSLRRSSHTRRRHM
jgi:hypothetical protein